MEKLINVIEAITNINVSFANLEKAIIDNPESIVGVVDGVGGALSSPVYGYEVQLSKQQLAEMRVQRIKSQYEKLMADYGIKVPAANKNVIRRAKKKVRLAKGDREARLMTGGNKSWEKSIKADIKEAQKMLKLVTGTPAAEVYLNDIKNFEQQLAELAA